MSGYAEAGIARTQAAAAKSKGAAGLKEHHNWNIAYLNERILVSLMAIATLRCYRPVGNGNLQAGDLWLICRGDCAHLFMGIRTH